MKGLKERAFYSINFLLHLKEREFGYNSKKICIKFYWNR
ncbi:hypothetical protein HPHPH29_1352 [Helicobacter pylori Hp H-29]|nr:hypothetical protein HPHPH29_1352 [Helicobacter pylori Hp H-29]